MANGIIIIDKPAGWTSMDVCGKLRGILKTKKVGHAGTLDPMATGVLPVFVGQATRAVSFAESGSKEYVAGLHLGCVTNTQDTSGEVLEQHPVSVTRQELEALLSPTDSLFRQYPAYTIPSAEEERRCRCGNPLTATVPDGLYRVYSGDGAFLCLSRAEGGVLTSQKNFFGA